MDYGKNMKEIRTMELYSQKYVGELLGISRSTYKIYEAQNSIIPINHLNNFCNIFKVSLDYIFGFNKAKNYSHSRYEEINKDISGARLKDFRQEHKITQEALAKYLNTTHSVISDYERGRYLIGTAFLYAICKKYKVSADYLTGKTDEPKYLR